MSDSRQLSRRIRTRLGAMNHPAAKSRPAADWTALAAEVTERTRQAQMLSEALARSTSVKDEMLAELDRVHSRQRDAVNRLGEAGRAERDVEGGEELVTDHEGRGRELGQPPAASRN